MTGARIQVERRGAAARCAVCHDQVELDVACCLACRTVLHLVCAGELARCPTLGCAGGPRLAPQRRLSPSDRLALAAVAGGLLGALTLLAGLALGAGLSLHRVAPDGLVAPAGAFVGLGVAAGLLAQALQERLAHRTSRALTYGPYLVVLPLLLVGTVVGAAIGEDRRWVRRSHWRPR